VEDLETETSNLAKIAPMPKLGILRSMDNKPKKLDMDAYQAAYGNSLINPNNPDPLGRSRSQMAGDQMRNPNDKGEVFEDSGFSNSKLGGGGVLINNFTQDTRVKDNMFNIGKRSKQQGYGIDTPLTERDKAVGGNPMGRNDTKVDMDAPAGNGFSPNQMKAIGRNDTGGIDAPKTPQEKAIDVVKRSSGGGFSFTGTGFPREQANNILSDNRQARMSSSEDSTKGFAEGGQVIGTDSSQDPTMGFANGGDVDHPVGPTDTVDAKLTPGEFVFTKDAVDVIGADKLHNAMKKAEAVKKGIMRGYASGGFVDDPALRELKRNLTYPEANQPGEVQPAHGFNPNIDPKREIEYKPTKSPATSGLSLASDNAAGTGIDPKRVIDYVSPRKNTSNLSLEEPTKPASVSVAETAPARASSTPMQARIDSLTGINNGFNRPSVPLSARGAAEQIAAANPVVQGKGNLINQPEPTKFKTRPQADNSIKLPNKGVWSAEGQAHLADSGIAPTNSSAPLELTPDNAPAPESQAKGFLRDAKGIFGKTLRGAAGLGSAVGIADLASEKSVRDKFLEAKANRGDENAKKALETGGSDPIMEKIKAPVRGAISRAADAVSGGAKYLADDFATGVGAAADATKRIGGKNIPAVIGEKIGSGVYEAIDSLAKNPYIVGENAGKQELAKPVSAPAKVDPAEPAPAKVEAPSLSNVAPNSGNGFVQAQNGDSYQITDHGAGIRKFNKGGTEQPMTNRVSSAGSFFNSSPDISAQVRNAVNRGDITTDAGLGILKGYQGKLENDRIASLPANQRAQAQLDRQVEAGDPEAIKQSLAQNTPQQQLADTIASKTLGAAAGKPVDSEWMSNFARMQHPYGDMTREEAVKPKFTLEKLSKFELPGDKTSVASRKAALSTVSNNDWNILTKDIAKNSANLGDVDKAILNFAQQHRGVTPEDVKTILGGTGVDELSSTNGA